MSIGNIAKKDNNNNKEEHCHDQHPREEIIPKRISKTLNTNLRKVFRFNCIRIVTYCEKELKSPDKTTRTLTSTNL